MKKMQLFFYSLLLLFITISINASETGYGKYSPSSFSADNKVVIVNWNSQEGIKRLVRSKNKQDFYQLANFFQPQINPLYCGIATSTIVLNAMRMSKGNVPSQEKLEIKKPQIYGGDSIPYPAYSQYTFLNEKTEKIKARTIIELKNITPENTNNADNFDPGLTLSQLKDILETYEIEAELNYAEKKVKEGLKNFRMQLKSVLKDKESFLIVNFKGKTFGALTGGHISPLAAYDRKTDSVLILDVAGHKNPWYWVPLPHLYQAMNTKDGNTYRGWLVVKDAAQ